MTSLRILVSGDVGGNFHQLFSRVNSIQKKSGAFDLLICVGDFFGDRDDEWATYVMGARKVPIPTLVLGPNKPEHVKYYSSTDGCELADNVTYLGKKGVFTGSSGLQLAYLSGVESEDGTSDDTHYNISDILSLTRSLEGDKRGVDILVTSQWPKNVTKYGISLDEEADVNGSEAVSQLCLRLCPRYHFCSLAGVHYERQPYRNHKVLAEKERHVTRFIALAKFGNPKKKKFLYAFSIKPMSLMEQQELTAQPEDVTECPYKPEQLAANVTLEDKASQFFYNMSEGSEEDKRKRKRKDQGDSDNRKMQRKPSQPTGPCWFCLGSPEVEKQLVVSVGNDTYLALPKGGLVPDHVLILPIGHHQSTVALPTEEHKEIEQYKSALKKCFKKAEKAVVFFERNYRTQHLQIQAVPVPKDCVSELKEIFIECAQENNFELHEIPQHSDLKQIVPPGAPYFYAELPSGDKLLHRISKNFPLQFGREVLTCPGILNMPERVDWKQCKCSMEEEKQQAKNFKSAFKNFDFSL